MANTYTIDVHGLPNPDAMAPGNAIKTADIRALTGCVNHAWAQVAAQPVVSQSWPTGFVERALSAQANIATWRIPRLTADHTTVWCEVYAAGGINNGGTVYFTSANSGEGVTIAVAGGGAFAFGGHTLTIGTPATFDTITMDIRAGSGGAGGTVQITDMHISHLLLPSPLGTGIATTHGGATFTANGETAAGADNPLTSSRGNRNMDSLRAIRESPRVLFNYSGINTPNISSGTNAAKAHPWIGADPYRQMVPTWPGSRAAGVTYTLKALVEPHATDLTRIIMRIGQTWPESRGDQTIVVAVAASALGDTWVTKSFTLKDNARALRGVEWPHISIGTIANEWEPTTKVVPFDSDLALQYRSSNARIKSLVVWGE